jgi:hypothetical protein
MDTSYFYVVHEVRVLKYALSHASLQYAYRVSIYLGSMDIDMKIIIFPSIY